ncbi:zinc finger protein with KRAB and SCAN domains 1-like [Megalops cyprinoides]|uniref:zinc finger protein with KRAB and SCAN domains 1-like n=1 Tax=Megalops cyprinoides TaxID=118141 RepID=UPI001864D8C1|nr:zinc finger protein with KRAB and SCAN domains 1-like [Megalops cyprinoides]
MSGTMSNCIAFHTQIASIMEVLANAAVAEICQVVDDGYAVLRLEVSQYQKENKSLKRKIQMMERQSARRCAERAGERTGAVSSSAGDGAQVCRKLRATTGEDRCFTTGESVLGKRLDVSLKRDEQPMVLNEDTQEQCVVKRAEVCSRILGTDIVCAETRGTRPESLVIKEERLKVNTGPQRELKIREERAVELGFAGDKEGNPVNTETKAAQHTEELTEQHRTRHSAWEVSGLEDVLKAEPDKDSVKTLPSEGSEYRAGRLSSLGSESVMCERTSHLGTCFTQGRANAEAEDPSCSYAAEMDSESLSVHSQLQSAPAAEGAGSSLSSFASFDWKPEIVMVDSAAVKLEGEMPSVWDKGTTEITGHAQQRQYEESGEGEGARSESVTAVCLPRAEMAVRDNPAASRCVVSESEKAHHRLGMSEKRLFYTYFEKGYSRPKDSEMHHSMDAGDRQFSCTQCGKQFAHSANLKRHQRVHTGEKPFSCTQCEKRFSHQHQLKMHQRVHTGERPFNCTHCGKRFTQSSHIKRHLSVHTAEIL